MTRDEGARRADETVTHHDDERPGRIDAVPVRHPGRVVAVVVIALLGAMLLSSLLTNARWDLGFAWNVMRYRPVLAGLLKGTILCTLGAMVIGVVLGILLAVMRLSDNPVLRWCSFVYTWFFRAVPRLVLLVMLGTGLGYLYPKLDVGLPFSKQLAGWLGLSSDLQIGSIDVNALSSGLIVGIIGLGLSEAAYMAEIARAGILSVDRGQTEAAQSLGMNPRTTMRRVVLPQAMRFIVPPTGNETIAMTKDTSLLSAVPIASELWFQASDISNKSGQVMGAYVGAVVWYLVVCSVLMALQHLLERRFGRGHSATSRHRRTLTTTAKGA